MSGTQMDCANVHLFGGHPDMTPQLRATRDVLQAFNMAPPAGSTTPCWISDALGQKNNLPQQGTAASVFTGLGVADAASYLGLKIASIFGSAGDNAVPVINPDGTLDGFGCDVRDTWGDLVPADVNNGTWTRHLARRGECFAFPTTP